MGEAEVPRYWCHMCSQNVNPSLEIDAIKCPICQSGFVEEMATAAPENDSPPPPPAVEFGGADSDSDRALSMWAPILLGMMGNQQRRHRMRRMGFEEGENDNDNDNDNDHDDELDRELEAILRRRRSSAAILQLLQGMRARILSDDQGQGTAAAGTDGDNERVILINPFNQTVIVHDDSISRAPIGSLGDYFIGPRLDLLLQHLSENDPNRFGTPPAQKEAVEALPTVKIEDTLLQCSVCLDEYEIGDEVKEMPCKHKFHSKCILPWLELHSSCPICRHQLPSKLDSTNAETNNDAGDDRNERGGRHFSVPLPWPFSSLFSSNANPSTSSHRDEN